jgi:pilus assembly protein Flp/PilA
MARIVRSAMAFLRREDGPTAVEYAVMLALIIVVCIAAIGDLGLKVNDVCDSVCQYIRPENRT